MKDIKRIVLTGGPCAGKTTALVRIIEHFSNLGFKVFTVPEVPTMYSQGGWSYLTPNHDLYYEGELAILRTQLALEDSFMRLYNPQNEMFRKSKTTRSAMQNEMFLFRIPSQQRKNASDFSGAFPFSPRCFKRSNQTSHSRRHQAVAVCVPGCSRICVRCQGSALCFSVAGLSDEP